MLNKALRLVRVYHDLNLSQAAERLGISKSYLSELENGSKTASIDVLNKYATAFDMPVSSLMLFVERAEDGPAARGAAGYVADKALKMLDWIATISDDRENQSRGRA